MAGARSLTPSALHTVQMLVMMIAATLAVIALSGLAIVTDWWRFWLAVPCGQAVYADAARRLRRTEPNGFNAWIIHMLIASGYLIAGGVPTAASIVVLIAFSVMGVGWSGRENRQGVLVISLVCGGIVAGGLYLLGEFETGTGGQIAVTALFMGLVTIPVLGSIRPVRRWFIERTTRFHESLFADMRLSDLLIDIPTGYYRTGPEGEIVETNPAYREQVGRDDLDGIEHETLVKETSRGELKNVGSDTYIERVERSYTRPDGRVVWLLESVKARVDSSGEIAGHEAITEDISAHREYEEAMDLAMSSLHVRLRYQVGIGQMARLLHLGSTEVVLPSALEPLQKACGGWLALDLNGERVVELGQPFEASRHSTAIESNATRVGDLSWAIADGHDQEETRDVMETASDLIGGFLQRVDVEKELHGLNVAKDQFIASVSHELRTPLTGIVGFTQYLQTSWEELDERERHSLLQTLSSESLEMSAIIEDLLVATRAKLYEMDVQVQQTNALEGVQDVVAGLGVRYDTAAVSIHLDDRLSVLADPLRYRQILRNLVTNAFRHGGDTIEVRALSGDDSAIISVVDDGPPIPEERRRRIFDPYQRGGSDRLQDSIGLGLSVSKTLAEMMGGTLSYKWDGESSFDLRLPTAG